MGARWTQWRMFQRVDGCVWGLSVMWVEQMGVGDGRGRRDGVGQWVSGGLWRGLRGVGRGGGVGSIVGSLGY